MLFYFIAALFYCSASANLGMKMGGAHPGASFSKDHRKILGKLLILLLLLLHCFLLLRWTELIGLLVQCSTVALYPLVYVATCVSVAPKIRSFPKIFLGTFENAAPDCFSFRMRDVKDHTSRRRDVIACNNSASWTL